MTTTLPAGTLPAGRLPARRAAEALRSGVPSRDAVAGAALRGVRLERAGRRGAGAAWRHPDAAYVRAWINEWDLVCLDPTFAPQTDVSPVAFSYAEQPELDIEQ